MSLCILLIFIYTVFLGKVASHLQALNPVFWLESIAVVAFGVSWLVKGEAILKDKVQTQENSL
jgi:uncharacterized membrane protein